MTDDPRRIGVLTGGGDCPGLNAVIRAVVRQEMRGYGGQVFGFHDGWRGVIENEGEELDVDRLRGTLPRGGTIIGTSRITPYMVDDGPAKVQATMQARELDALIVIGGEGTLACAARIHDEGVAKVVGVPKTIDNDIPGTERTFGFDTAVSIATDAIDRLHTTAESHDRIMVVEVMGRHVGHIATWAGHFFTDLEGAEGSLFYAPVGKIGLAFMEIEIEAFRMESRLNPVEAGPNLRHHQED